MLVFGGVMNTCYFISVGGIPKFSPIRFFPLITCDCKMGHPSGLGWCTHNVHIEIRVAVSLSHSANG